MVYSPQVMANRPILCQSFVDSAMQSVQDCWLQMYIIHYMDDILIAVQNGEEVLKCYDELKQALQNRELEIATDKVQLKDPDTYLGFQMRGSKISSQKLKLRLDKLKTLNDFQKKSLVISIGLCCILNFANMI